MEQRRGLHEISHWMISFRNIWKGVNIDKQEPWHANVSELSLKWKEKRTFCKIKCGALFHLEASKGNRNNYTWKESGWQSIRCATYLILWMFACKLFTKLSRLLTHMIQMVSRNSCEHEKALCNLLNCVLATNTCDDK